MSEFAKEPSPPRRDYSRGGCRECKRRKIKCDETKPHCHHCTRLKKECTYPQAGEKVLRVSRRYLDENPLPDPALAEPKSLTIQLYQGPKSIKRRKKRKIKTDRANSEPPQQPPTVSPSKPGIHTFPLSASPIGTLLNETPGNFSTAPLSHTRSNFSRDSVYSEEMNGMSPINSGINPGYADSPSLNDPSLYANESPSSVAWDTLYNKEDLDLLASDLNTIVNDIMFQSNFKGPGSGPGPAPISVPLPETPINHNVQKPQNLPLPNGSIAKGTEILDEIPKHIPVDYIKVSTGYERIYLEDFYHGFANQLLPFGAYDPLKKIYANPIRDVLMKYASNEPFLLAAMLAQGAKTSYEKNHLQRDQEAYGSYLSTCLNLLGPALSRNRDKSVRNDLTSNIECILLTVLLLTSANAANKKQSWRPHLKGAKDIILKATNSRIRQSKALIICKVWFIDFEMLAGLSSPFGGTLKTDEELNSVVNLNDEYELSVLKEFGIIHENGFNVVFGYSNAVAYLFRDLIKIFNQKRADGEAFKPEDSLRYVGLLAGFYQSHNVVYFSRKCHGPSISGDLIDVILVPHENISISWMDLSQQAYTLAGMITVFTQILDHPLYSPYIQDLVSKLVSLISYLEKCFGNPRHMIEHSVSMVQWPMYVAAMNCVEEHHKYLLIKFFRILGDLGSGSAEHALKRIMRVWDARDKGVEEEEEGVDVDVVAY